MVAYSWETEISRRLHNSFAIAWGIPGVTILVLLPITNYSNIPKELYITRGSDTMMLFTSAM